MARDARPKYEYDDRQSEVYTGSGGRPTLQLPAGLNFFKPKKSGFFRIEVIPFLAGPSVSKFASNYRFTTAGKWHWNVMFRMHGGVGPDNNSVVCSYGTFGKACPICEQKAVLSRSAHKQDKEAVKTLNSKERQILLVAERDDRSGELGELMLWEVSTFCFHKQLELLLDSADREDKEAHSRFWRHETGLTMKVVVKEESMGNGATTFSKYTPMELKPRREPLPSSIFDHGFDLYSMVRERSYSDVKQMFYGVSAEEEVEPEDYEPAEAPRENPGPEVQDKKSPPPSDMGGDAFDVGDLVTVWVGDRETGGRLVEVDNIRMTAKVKVPGNDSLATYDFEEMRAIHIKPKEVEDLKKAEPEESPAPKPRKSQAGWDESESQAPAPKKKPK